MEDPIRRRLEREILQAQAKEMAQVAGERRDFMTISHQDETVRKNIYVVSAIILRDRKALATQRGYGDYAGWCEFPGGKIEDGETPEAALIREIKEELKADIKIDRYFGDTEYDYPKFHLSMKCYLGALASPTIDLTEHLNEEWFDRTNAYDRKWLSADIPIIDKLIAEGVI
jgi:8-oxo-dGTP diphosphatase